MIIDIGPGASVKGAATTQDFTYIDGANPANAHGRLQIVQIYLYNSVTGVKVGTFYGSGASYTLRDYVTLGSIDAGFQVFRVGLQVDTGDLLGIYIATGSTTYNTSGGIAMYYKGGDYFVSGAQTYDVLATYILGGVYGLGWIPNSYVRARRDRLNMMGVSVQAS